MSKQPLILTRGANGKRVNLIDRDELDKMLDEGSAEHVKGNLYQTKVMVAQTLPTPTVPAYVEPPPAKRKRGRPRKV